MSIFDVYMLYSYLMSTYYTVIWCLHIIQLFDVYILLYSYLRLLCLLDLWLQSWWIL